MKGKANMFSMPLHSTSTFRFPVAPLFALIQQNIPVPGAPPGI